MAPPFLRISLLTSGRFHLCDLARELQSLGHQVTLSSLVPPWRTKKYGLTHQSAKWLGIRLSPLLLQLKLTRSSAKIRLLRERLSIRLDEVAAKQLQPCDVFIGMSGMCNRTAARAKQYGAQVRIQRCSRHILSQKEILAKIPGAEQVSDFDVRRELFDYELADTVDVPSIHCVESFLDQGFSHDRVFCNPFGVDLECFKTTLTPPLPVCFIMVGTWSLRKGCDQLLQAWRQIPGTHLLHVGPVGDLPLPDDANFTHIDPVPQRDLPTYYSKAHVMCLASREEGLAFVQPQALACGLKLVCTTRTGGADLQKLIQDREAISVVPPDDVDALRSAMQKSIEHLAKAGSTRDVLAEFGRKHLSWNKYAERYINSISEKHSL